MRLHKAMGWAGVHPDREWLSDRLYENEVPGEVAALMASAMAAAQAAGNAHDRLALTLQQDRPNLGIRSYPRLLSEIVTYADNIDATRDGLWVIAPPSTAGDWHRVDDDLDYHDRRWTEEWEATVVRRLPVPPHPYHSWCRENPLTGRREALPEGVDSESFTCVPPAPVQAIAEALRFPDWRALQPTLVTWWS